MFLIFDLKAVEKQIKLLQEQIKKIGAKKVNKNRKDQLKSQLDILKKSKTSIKSKSKNALKHMEDIVKQC